MNIERTALQALQKRIDQIAATGDDDLAGRAWHALSVVLFEYIGTDGNGRLWDAEYMRRSLRQRGLIRSAPLAGAKSCPFRIRARDVEAYVLAPCQARRARGPAIDARRPNGIVKSRVSGRVATHDRSPPVRVFQIMTM